MPTASQKHAGSISRGTSPAPSSLARPKNPASATTTAKSSSKGKEPLQPLQPQPRAILPPTPFEECPFTTTAVPIPDGVATARSEAAKLTAATPAAAAALFLRCLLVRSTRKALGNKIIVPSLHPRCLTKMQEADDDSETHPTMLIRKHTVKQLQAISKIPNAVQALVLGTSSEAGGNSYAYEASATAFAVQKITGWSNERGAPLPTADGTSVDVHFEATGTLPGHPTTRKVTMELHGGKWLARDCADLAKAVLPPTTPVLDDEEEAAQKALDSYQIVRRTEMEFLSAGPVDLYANSRMRARGIGKRGSGEQKEARMERHARAEASTAGLAHRLSAVELNTKFVADPQHRKIVNIKGGMIKSRYIKPGELYDASVGFDARVMTVEEEQAEELREKEHAALTATLKGRIRTNRAQSQAESG